MDGRDSSATLGMTWVVMGNDGKRVGMTVGRVGVTVGTAWDGLRRGNFCKSSPAPPQNFLGLGVLAVLNLVAGVESRFLGYARNDMGNSIGEMMGVGGWIVGGGWLGRG